MTIEWFPGHMATARREAAETMRQTDLVIEVLDARIPYSSCNPLVETLRKENQRPALKLLNKADAADPAQTRRWLDHYNAMPNVKALAISAIKGNDVSRIPNVCQEMVPQRGTVVKPLRLMILGIPNVGKSTLMNSLLKRHVANVGDEPAITRMQMRHDIKPGMVLVDTPGMLWPGLAQDVALKLAAAHSVGRAAYDHGIVATDLAAYLLKEYPALLAKRYGPIPDGTLGHSMLEHIAALRSLTMKGGVPDVGRAAIVLLNDFRSGALGAITLETVEQVDARVAATPRKPKKKK